MATCKDCLHYEACSSLAEIVGTPFRNMIDGAESRCYTFKNVTIKTNADRIRAMSDYDLEDFLLTEEWMCDAYDSCSVCPLRGEKGCISILEWLKQPADEREVTEDGKKEM